MINKYNKINIQLIKERNILELFNDSVNFVIQNFNILVQLFLSVSLPFIAISVFLAYAPSSFHNSSLYKDVSQIIFSQTYHLGFNPVYTVLTGFVFSTAVYNFMDMYSKKEKAITLYAIYNHIKPNLLALISMALVITVGFCVLIAGLILLDIDFKDMFGFSLFYISYVLFPVIIYFIFSSTYITIQKQLSFVEGIKKIKSYFDKPWQVLLSVLFIMIILYLFKYIMTQMLFILITLFSINDYVIMFTIVAGTFTQLIYFSILIFASIYVALLYNSQVARHEGNELVNLVNEI